MKTSLDTIKSRFKKRSLPDLLVRKFLTEYGYDHGPVIARAIVEDILATIEQVLSQTGSAKDRDLVGCSPRVAGAAKGTGYHRPGPNPIASWSPESEIELLVAPALRKESNGATGIQPCPFCALVF